MNRSVRLPVVLVLLGCCACGRTVTYTRPAGCTQQPRTEAWLKLNQLDGLPRLWNTDVCIPVTYQPSLEALRPTLDAALDAWTSQSCSGLCFLPPMQRADTPVDQFDYRLHAADSAPALGGAWELVNDGNTGRTLHATIFVSTNSNVGEVLKQLGQTLGFLQGSGRDTVLDEVQVPNPRTDLGTLDKQSVCAAYPPCR